MDSSQNDDQQQANPVYNMRQVQFGNTGRQVSAIGLGGGQYVYDDHAQKQEIIDVIQYAYSLGINYFDTAPIYQSESTFGVALQNFDRSTFFLASKVGRYSSEDVLKQFDLTAQRTEASIQNSLSLLRTDYIDLIQVHDFDYAENATETLLSETLPFLDKMRQRGIIKYIGLTSYDLPKMKTLVERSPIKIDSILSHSRLTLIDQGLKDFLPFFKEKGVAVVNAAALSLGLLSSHEIPAWMNVSQELKAASRKAVCTCALSKYVLERLANAYSYTEGEKLGVDVLLTGAASKRVLDLNLKSYFEGLTKAERSMCAHISQDIFGVLAPEHRDVNKIANEAHFKLVAAARRASISLPQ